VSNIKETGNSPVIPASKLQNLMHGCVMDSWDRTDTGQFRALSRDIGTILAENSWRDVFGEIEKAATVEGYIGGGTRHNRAEAIERVLSYVLEAYADKIEDVEFCQALGRLILILNSNSHLIQLYGKDEE
jgi:hypothetical protein